MTCPHLGILTVTPVSPALTANTNVAINKSETLNGVIAACTWTNGTPCTGISMVGGESGNLTKNGSGVILANSTLTTNGTPGPFTITIMETQTVLKG